MQLSIIKINIENELDVVLAYKRAMQLSERVGIALANQTKFATAVSEICRNVIEHVGTGSIQVNITGDNKGVFLEALISDRGRGISNIDDILQRSNQGMTGKGTGLINSKKLVDEFQVDSDSEKGTRVILRKRIPAVASTRITKQVIEQWLIEFDYDADISPYAEIKSQNMQLLKLLEELRLRNLEAEQQLQEIRRLNNQLQFSNEEIKELLVERERKNQLLQKINGDLDAFAHTVSHDLRAPLQNINGLSVVLEACLEANDQEEALQVFPMIREQTGKMDRLITSILAYSLAGHHNIRKQLLDIQVVLHQVVESLNVPVSFKVIIPDNLPLLYSQEVYLYQIFSNLIGNSIKYHDNFEKPTIEISYRQLDNCLEFTVQDNGPGIRQSDMNEIFNMYETLGQNLTRSDSTGIGLAIVQKILHGKGEKIRIESEGRGAKFIFTWPLDELVEEDHV